MLTDLLGKTVKYTLAEKDIVGIVHAVYLEERGLVLLVTDEEGKFSPVIAGQATLIQMDNVFAVLLHWGPQQKISAIKMVRHILQFSLKDAKDFVESKGSPLRLKERLTEQDAYDFKKLCDKEGGSLDTEVVRIPF